MSADFDENLVIRIASGDRDAFRAVYEASSRAVYGFAYSILGDRHDAEDVMHDAYLRMHRAAASYQPQGKPLAWLLTIVRNLCYDRIRSRQSDAAKAGQAQAAPHHRDLTEERMLLEEALASLQEEDRQIVVLHALTGLKHREIADLVGLPLNTVLSRYSRSLKKLKAVLES